MSTTQIHKLWILIHAKYKRSLIEVMANGQQARLLHACMSIASLDCEFPCTVMQARKGGKKRGEAWEQGLSIVTTGFIQQIKNVHLLD